MIGVDSPPAGGAAEGGADSSPATDTGALACESIDPRWSYSDVVDAADSAALAADPHCGASIAYEDHTGHVWLARVDHGKWLREELALTGKVVALAATDAGLHLLLYRTGEGLFYVARRGGTVEAPERIEAAGGARGELAIDEQGTVHATFESLQDGQGLRHAVRSAGGWAVETIDSRMASDPSIALGPNGSVFVGYQYITNSEDHACVLASKTQSGWSLLPIQSLDINSISSDACTARVSRNGTVSIAFEAYRAEGGHVARYGRGIFPSLTFDTIDVANGFGMDAWATALDPAGDMHTAYRGIGQNSGLAVANIRAGAKPVIDPMTRATEASGVRVAIDSAGTTHVLYFQGQLTYAVRGAN